MTAMRPVLFGRLLREHRERRGLTRRQMCEAVNCAEITLRKIEAGERRPSLQMAHLLADALQLAPAERTVFIAEASAIADSTSAARRFHPPNICWRWPRTPRAATRMTSSASNWMNWKRGWRRCAPC